MEVASNAKFDKTEATLSIDQWQRLEEEVADIKLQCQKKPVKGFSRFNSILKRYRNHPSKIAFTYFVRAQAMKVILGMATSQYLKSNEILTITAIIEKIYDRPTAKDLLHILHRTVPMPSDDTPVNERYAGERSESELDELSRLVHDVFGFDDEGEDIRIILSADLSSDDKEQTKTNDDGPPRSWEGEAAICPDLMMVLRKAYPRRRIGTQLGCKEDLEAEQSWENRDLITLGAHNSNLAVDMILKNFDKTSWPDYPDIFVWSIPGAKERGDTFVGYKDKPNLGIYFQPNENEEGRCSDGAAILLRATNPYNPQRKLAMIAGNQTYGTAGGMLSLTKLQELVLLIERAKLNPGCDNFSIKVETGMKRLWPIKTEISFPT